MMDQRGDFLSCLVTVAMEYPERYAYQCLQELLGQAHGYDLHAADEGALTETLQPVMQQLIDKYEDPLRVANSDFGTGGIVTSDMQRPSIEPHTFDEEAQEPVSFAHDRRLLTNARSRKVALLGGCVVTVAAVIATVVWWQDL